MSLSNVFRTHVSAGHRTIAPRKIVYQEVPPQADEHLLQQRQAEQLKDQAGRLQQQAEQAWKETQEKIRQEENDSQARIAAWAEEAKQQGYAEGFESGKQEGLEAWQQQISHAGRIIESAEQAFHERLNEAEPTVIDIAVQALEKMLGPEWLPDEHWRMQLSTAVSALREQGHIRVLVSAGEYEEVRMYKEELQSAAGSEQKVTIYPDAQMRQSQCVLETDFGKIDVSLETQLQELKKQLQAVVKEGMPV